jgi:hypothetical protein
MSSPKPLTIEYELSLSNGTQRRFKVVLDPTTLLAARDTERRPDWARLDNCKCPNCPLQSESSPYCPAATRVAEVVDGFAESWSFEETEVRVNVGDRTIAKKTDVQSALGSLLGVYLATSGCPVLGKLRPLVRFHLPFSTELETIFRVTSMYLVAQYLRAAHGETPDWSLRGLSEMYENIGIVNYAFAARLRDAAPKDAHINALILLDAFAKALPDSIDQKLAELHPLLQAWSASAHS